MGGECREEVKWEKNDKRTEGIMEQQDATERAAWGLEGKSEAVREGEEGALVMWHVI